MCNIFAGSYTCSKHEPILEVNGPGALAAFVSQGFLLHLAVPGVNLEFGCDCDVKVNLMKSNFKIIKMI